MTARAAVLVTTVAVAIAGLLAARNTLGAPAVTPPPSASATEPPPATAPAPAPAEPSRYGELMASLETSEGVIRLRLEPDLVPRITANFVNLAQTGFYDGTTFHAVADDYQIHGGDRTATGDGDGGYEVAPQFSSRMLFDQAGVIGMWAPRRRPSTQFFITLRPNPRKYNLNQAAFGRVVEGLDVARSIRPGATLIRVRIEGDTAPLLADFAAEIAAWNAAIERSGARVAPPAAPPSGSPPPVGGDGSTSAGRGRDSARQP